MLKFDSIGDINQFTGSLELEKAKLTSEISKLKSQLANKDLFISQITHDMRNPLSCINYMLDNITLIQEGSSLSESEQEELSQALDITKSNVETLQNLINDILDIGQMSKGTLKVLEDNFNLEELIKQMNKILQIQAKLKNIKFFCINLVPEKEQYLNSDQRRLKQILFNLTSNAFKFTLQGSVSLQIQQISSNMLRFSVIDTGLGIKPEILQKLNKNIAYSTFDNDRGVNKEGIGLGLTICRKLAGLLGPQSDLMITSEIGKGSCFSFEIFKNIGKNSKKIQTYKSYRSKLFSEEEKSQINQQKNQQKNYFKNCSFKVNDGTIFKTFGQQLNKLNLNLPNICQSNQSISQEGFSNIQSILEGPQIDSLANILSEKEHRIMLSGQIIQNFPTLEKTNLLMLNKGSPSQSSQIQNIDIKKNQSQLEKSEKNQEKIQDEVVSDLIKRISSNNQFSNNQNSNNQQSKNQHSNNQISQSIILELQKIHIVIVDDNVFNLLVLEQFLKKNKTYKFEIEKASNGQICVDLFLKYNQTINENNIDIIIMDCDLPILNGYEASVKINDYVEFNNYINVVIIAYTANQGDEELAKCKKHRMDGYLSKPTTQQEFNQLLDQFLLNN